jgi:hypothetical protein
MKTAWRFSAFLPCIYLTPGQRAMRTAVRAHLIKIRMRSLGEQEKWFDVEPPATQKMHFDVEQPQCEAPMPNPMEYALVMASELPQHVTRISVQEAEAAEQMSGCEARTWDSIFGFAEKLRCFSCCMAMVGGDCWRRFF